MKRSGIVESEPYGFPEGITGGRCARAGLTAQTPTLTSGVAVGVRCLSSHYGPCEQLRNTRLRRPGQGPAEGVGRLLLLLLVGMRSHVVGHAG
jgi:hypothetical protein